jgi:succinate dehydrogenase/fumarate reductase cytochrome b subunit
VVTRPFNCGVRERLDQVHPIVTRIAGAVLLASGILSAVLASWIVERQLEFHGALALRSPPAVMVICFVLVAAFCLMVGYRLLLNRPNRYGSLLSPTGWRLLASFFVALGVWLGAVAIPRGSYGFLVAIPPLGLLVYRCLIAARTAENNAQPRALSNNALEQTREG